MDLVVIALRPLWREILWSQFGAAIDMLEAAIRACPEALWSHSSLRPGRQFWYIAYHTLFWLDRYLADSPDGFHPPAPFTLSEFDADRLPERVYTPEELLTYLRHCREKGRTTLRDLTGEGAARPWGAPEEMTRAERFLYNLRHVQHHAAQLNLLLRQGTDSAPDWVSVAGTPL